MWPFKSRTTEEIEANARQKERKECESHFLEELRKQRERYSEQREQTEKMHTDEINRILEEEKKKREELVRTISKRLNDQIRELKATVVVKEQKISDAQEAWKVFKEFLPEAITLSNMVKIKAEIYVNESTRKWQESLAIEGDFEKLGRKVKLLSPKIEALLVEDTVE